jgi:hypothetical protein
LLSINQFDYPWNKVRPKDNIQISTRIRVSRFRYDRAVTQKVKSIHFQASHVAEKKVMSGNNGT